MPIQLHYKLNKPPKHKPFTVRKPISCLYSFAGQLVLTFRVAYGNGPAILPTLASAFFESCECCSASKNDLRLLPPEFCVGGAFGRSPSPRARTVLFPVARKRHNTAQSSPRSSRWCTFNVPSSLTSVKLKTEPTRAAYFSSSRVSPQQRSRKRVAYISAAMRTHGRPIARTSTKHPS